MRSLHKNKFAFTLIELLLVVAVLSVMVGISLPAFKKTYNRLNLENIALNILSTARYARAKAIVESRIYRLNFDIEDKSYSLSTESDDKIEGFQPISGRFGKIAQITDDINIKTSADHVNFYPSGDSDEIIVVLKNTDGRVYTIGKSGVFGEFKIIEEKE
ncbi:MAG: prepilin-type N-terminal cleavage/methylation domain-containing protein [Candidatus Omnitrophica bacterium]|nr:prepilin-type N-terminal cleavage/methylation domain-containing protein [Candidatus Omnitrophota bacterium]